MEKDVAVLENIAEDSNQGKLGTDLNYKLKPRTFVKWYYIAFMHFAALYGLYAAVFYAKIQTLLWATFLTTALNQSVVLAAHRAYSHKSFTPTLPLKLVLVFFQTMAGQKDIYSWARDHRVHHKFVDTDADPHNATRGFFYAHIGWSLYEKHPLVVEKGKLINLDDLRADKVLMFQRRYYYQLWFLLGFLMPWVVPMYFWNEGFWISLCVSHYLAYTLSLHGILCINSFAHLYGDRPFDQRILPVQSNLVHWVTGGDGWHNFHHCFPWDYGLSEYGYGKGLATYLIEFFAYMGLAHDLKKASDAVVEGHAKKHGDKTREISR